MARIALVALTLTLSWGRAEAADHVRVVLDSSLSMVKNDSPRLASLSVLLLYDLARPNPSLGDTFEVYTFHREGKWENPSDPPPTAIGNRIGGVDRESLARWLRQQPYDAKWTYFYPGLKHAIGDLSRRKDPNDRGVIVFVTDGLPETPTREAELARIRSELTPQLEASGIQLYFLAFGPQAASSPEFFRAIVGTGGSSVGDLLIDKSGDLLLHSMARIFSQSFGYTVSRPVRHPEEKLVNLAGNSSPARVAALIYWRRPTPPSLALKAPGGGSVNAPEGVVQGYEREAGYALIWTLSPRPGLHEIVSNASDAWVALLRPTVLDLRILPATPGGRVDRAIAGIDFPLRVLVRPSGGAKGDSGEVELAFKVRGERKFDAETGTFGYEWSADYGAPPASDTGTATPEGRIYTIHPRFAKEPEPPAPFYVGHLELEARRHQALVAALTDEFAHRVEVYPYLAIATRPRQGDARTAGLFSREFAPLKRGQKGCSTFRFEVAGGRLPKRDSDRYGLRATLPETFSFDGPLNRAVVTLDGLPLQVENKPDPKAGAWYLGRELGVRELLGEHRVCLQTGRPAEGAVAAPIPVEIRFRLQESPYYEFDVVEPFSLAVQVAPPEPLDLIRERLPLLLFLFLPLALWYARARAVVPEDLSFSAGPPGDDGALAGGSLGPPSVISQALAAAGRRPALDDDGRVLGWVRPEWGRLYLFRPAKGWRARDLEGGEIRQAGRRLLLKAGETYVLEGGDGRLLFRLDYR